MFARAYVPGRSGQIFVVPEKGSFLLVREDTSRYHFMHGSPWDYDVKIPLLLYGEPFIRKGTFTEKAALQDVAPTIMRLLRSPVPTTMTGRVLEEAISDGEEAPMAVVVLVLDGMGLATWQRLEPKLATLSRLRAQGAWFENTAINFLPTATSTGHATIATGTDPRFHGIHGNDTFDRRSGTATDPFPDKSPGNYRALTLADYWTLQTSGRAVVIAQGTTSRAAVSLAGHGACTPNGRKIVMAMFDDKKAGWVTNESCYRLPDYLATEDATHVWEAASRSWLGHEVNDGGALLRTGLFPRFQVDALMTMIDAERVGRDSIPDLVLVNLKTTDYVSHQYGPESPEMEEATRAVDEQIGRLLKKLDQAVGAGRYVIAITADHGMPPEPVGKDQGRYYVDDIVAMIHERFDPEGKLVLNFADANHQIFIDHGRLDSLKLTLGELARSTQDLPFIRFAFTEDEVRGARIP